MHTNTTRPKYSPTDMSYNLFVNQLLIACFLQIPNYSELGSGEHAQVSLLLFHNSVTTCHFVIKASPQFVKILMLRLSKVSLSWMEQRSKMEHMYIFYVFPPVTLSRL